ncbi:nuclear transport factor 2 family protein [Mycolicibacterium baixiangningiae]|uniref:nuclear transport factor 2 family protein n=1 Tax=Mycolicibacterium baixiangningiae TaxID=2761578 RepID=UPI0018665869|nr:nuclear transport factor 2 family protein [Mycolicibacterium baixiangningiae]
MSLRELYDRYAAAWAGRDPDAIVALHADQTTFWLHDGRPAIEGRPAVRDAFAAMFEALPDLGFVVHRTEFGPRHWVLDWTATSTGSDGRPVCFDCMDLVTVSDDWRVARKDTFVDGAQFLRALGG